MPQHEHNTISCPICAQQFDPDVLEMDEETRNRCIVAWRLRTLRMKRGWSLEFVGSLLGTGHRAISFWETGQRDISIKRAMQFCHLYGISLDHLLEGVRYSYPGEALHEAPRS